MVLTVERVSSARFLGVHITEDLSWTRSTSSVGQKAQQCLQFLWKRAKITAPAASIMWSFHRGATENILSRCKLWSLWARTSRLKDSFIQQAVGKLFAYSAVCMHTLWTLTPPLRCFHWYVPQFLWHAQMFVFLSFGLSVSLFLIFLYDVLTVALTNTIPILCTCSTLIVLLTARPARTSKALEALCMFGSTHLSLKMNNMQESTWWRSFVLSFAFLLFLKSLLFERSVWFDQFLHMK